MNKRLTKISRLQEKWTQFKYLRNQLKEFGHDHPDFLTMLQREEMIDKLFDMV